MTGLCDGVRRACARIAASAVHVRIRDDVDIDVDGRDGLDPDVHLLDAPLEDRARYVLVLDAINFGSGWFPELERATGGEDVTTAISRALTAHAASGGWTNAELRHLDATAIADVLPLDPDHALAGLYARALNDLGRWLGDRSARAAIEAASAGSAERLAAALAGGMPFFADRGFYKRAQITAADLVLAGVAAFSDVDRLTVFADNLVPHVLRIDGVLEYTPDLAQRIDAGEELPAGSLEEREIRACAVEACERLASRAGIPPRVLDNRLWNRGLTRRYADLPPHRTRTVFY